MGGLDTAIDGSGLFRYSPANFHCANYSITVPIQVQHVTPVSPPFLMVPLMARRVHSPPLRKPLRFRLLRQQRRVLVFPQERSGESPPALWGAFFLLVLELSSCFSINLVGSVKSILESRGIKREGRSRSLRIQRRRHIRRLESIRSGGGFCIPSKEERGCRMIVVKILRSYVGYLYCDGSFFEGHN